MGPDERLVVHGRRHHARLDAGQGHAHPRLRQRRPHLRHRSRAAATPSRRRRPRTCASPRTTSTTVALAWNASTDNVGVTGYQVFRGTTLVASPTGLAFTDTGLAPSTTFSYTVRALDAAGNQSAASAAVSATTGPPVPDTQPPTAPTNLRGLEQDEQHGLARVDGLDRQRRRHRLPRARGHDAGRHQRDHVLHRDRARRVLDAHLHRARGGRGRERVRGQQRGDGHDGRGDRLEPQGAVPRGRHERDRPADQAAH